MNVQDEFTLGFTHGFHRVLVVNALKARPMLRVNLEVYMEDKERLEAPVAGFRVFLIIEHHSLEASLRCMSPWREWPRATY